MISHIVFLISFLFVTVIAGDNYVHTFAQEWPGSICKGYTCLKAHMGNYDGKRFNMHGLWPNLYNGLSTCQTLDTCTSELYNQASLSSATLKLVELGWVGLYSSSETFRKHEWEKHGTCLRGKTQDGFFSQVMSLSSKYNVYNALAAKGIYPSDTATITQTQIVQAVQSQLGTTAADVHMSCIKDGIKKKKNQFQKASGKFNLGQVKFCLGDNFQPRSCNCNVGFLENLQAIEQDIQLDPLSALVSCPSSLYYPNFIAVIQ